MQGKKEMIERYQVYCVGEASSAPANLAEVFCTFCQPLHTPPRAAALSAALQPARLLISTRHHPAPSLPQNSSVMQKDVSCRPLIFHSSGPAIGEPEPFPAPVMPQGKKWGAQSKSSKDESGHGSRGGVHESHVRGGRPQRHGSRS